MKHIGGMANKYTPNCKCWCFIGFFDDGWDYWKIIAYDDGVPVRIFWDYELNEYCPFCCDEARLQNDISSDNPIAIAMTKIIDFIELRLTNDPI